MATNNNHPSFPGFQFPTTTPVPDEVFDVLMPQLSGAELKVLLYICRRTFGFKKESDNISLNQISTGITTRDGRVLDRGTGLCKAAVVSAVTSLAKKGIIIRKRRQSVENGCEPTTYTLNFASLSNQQPGGCLKTKQGGVHQSRQGGVQKLDTQQTGGQETERQHDDDDVCAALENFGITQKTAKRLANAYPKAHVLSKLGMVERLVATESPLVAKNPQGFLVKAIAEDYPPPAQFKPKAQREEKERADHQEVARHHEEHPPVAPDATPEPSADPSRTPETVWSRTLALLQEHVPAPSFATWVKDTMLVGIGNGVARIKVPSTLAASWLERMLYWRIIRALSDILPERAVTDVQFVTA
jgi:hypothetical protein